MDTERNGTISRKMRKEERKTIRGKKNDSLINPSTHLHVLALYLPRWKKKQAQKTSSN
jgi:hypothetical protein